LPTSVRSSHIVSSSHNRSGSADTQSNGGPPKRHALRIYFRARTAPPAASAQGRLRVNRVDFATSALASAIHNTGHSRPIGTGLPVALPPELQTTGAAAAAPAFCPRPAKRHELHLRSTKTRHINCAKSTRKLLASCLSWFLSDGGLANDSAGPARRRQPTA